METIIKTDITNCLSDKSQEEIGEEIERLIEEKAIELGKTTDDIKDYVYKNETTITINFK